MMFSNAGTFPFCTDLTYLKLKPHIIKHITSYPTVRNQYFNKSAHTNLVLTCDRYRLDIRTIQGVKTCFASKNTQKKQDHYLLLQANNHLLVKGSNG